MVVQDWGRGVEGGWGAGVVGGEGGEGVRGGGGVEGFHCLWVGLGGSFGGLLGVTGTEDCTS